MLAANLESLPDTRGIDGQQGPPQPVGGDGRPRESSAVRGDLLSSLTLSVGPVVVRLKFEIARIDDSRPVSAEALVDKPLPRPVLRGRLRRGPRSGILESRGSFQDPSRQEMIARSRPKGRGWRGLGGLSAVAGRAVSTTPLPSYGYADARPGRQSQLLNGENCTVVLSDVVAFGASSRNDIDRLIIREALFNMTHAALQGIPSGWSCDDRGDGLLMVVPPSVPTPNVMAQLVRELPSALERHNNTHRASAQIQLRVAVSVGPVVSDSMGVSGDAIIASARLVDAPVFKVAIANSTAILGVIASSFVYETAIKHSQDPAGYSQVQVEVKESNMPAWIKLFDAPMPFSYSQVSIGATSLQGTGS
jgi:hypothetical protein